MSNSIEVLNMIESGKISAAEGAQLLGALRSKPETTAILKNRSLRIRVSDLQTNRQRVNINLPASWVEFGLRIGRNFAPELNDIDWSQIMTSIKNGEAGRLLEVEDLEDNQRVEIFVE